MYKEKRSARSEFVPIRSLDYHVLHWGSGTSSSTDQTPLVLVHGWMDVAASYQFMVDAFTDSFMTGRLVLAPDWRGFGLTPAGNIDSFWFPDYLADLDFLLDHYFPGQQVDLVGHSMGGNVAMLYGGVRPERIRRLVNLEGFGLAATRPSQAPARYAKWMDELKGLHGGDVSLKSYDSPAGVAQRLMKTNQRLDAGKAAWLAERWAQPDAEGQWNILGHAAHKLSNPQLYRVEEVLEIYRRITALVLSVEADSDSLSQWWKGSYTIDEFHDRLKHVPQVLTEVIRDAGHMLHHDQPEHLAGLIEDFLA
jgi:pimeloyl-ACP methyl ester carboxylesterase